MLKPIIRFEAAINECELHMKHLNHALDCTTEIFPLDNHSFADLSLDQVGFLDQMIFRFTKLQECIGEKLFNSGLDVLGELTEQLTMIDKLNRLEKIGA